MSSFLMSAFGSEEFQDQLGGPGQTPLNIDLDNNTPTLQVEAANGEYLQTREELDRGADIVDAMESLQEVIGSFGNEHLDERHLALIQCAGQFAAAGSPISPRAVIPAYESYTGTLGSESIGEKIKNTLTHITGFMSKAAEGAGKVFSHIAFVFKTNAGKIKKLRAMVEKSAEEKFTLSGKIPWIPVSGDLHSALQKQLANVGPVMEEALKFSQENLAIFESFKKSEDGDAYEVALMNQAHAFKNTLEKFKKFEGVSEGEHPSYLLSGVGFKIIEGAPFPSDPAQIQAYYKAFDIKRVYNESEERSEVPMEMTKAQLLQILADYESAIQKANSQASRAVQANSAYVKHIGTLGSAIRAGAGAGGAAGAIGVGALMGNYSAQKGTSPGHAANLNPNLKNSTKSASGKFQFKDHTPEISDNVKKEAAKGALYGASVGSVVGGVAGGVAHGVSRVLTALFSKTYKILSKSEKLTVEMMNFAHESLNVTGIMWLVRRAVRDPGAVIKQDDVLVG